MLKATYEAFGRWSFAAKIYLLQAFAVGAMAIGTVVAVASLYEVNVSAQKSVLAGEQLASFGAINNALTEAILETQLLVADKSDVLNTQKQIAKIRMHELHVVQLAVDLHGATAQEVVQEMGKMQPAIADIITLVDEGHPHTARREFSKLRVKIYHSLRMQLLAAMGRQRQTLYQSAERTRRIYAIIHRLLIITGIMAVGVVLLFSSVIVRSLIHRLNKVRDAIQSVAKGNLRVLVPVDSKDALGEIAIATNTMSEHLQQMTLEIQEAAQQQIEISERLSGAMRRVLEAVNTNQEHTRQAKGAIEDLSRTAQSVSEQASSMSETVESAQVKTKDSGQVITESLATMDEAEKTIQNAVVTVGKMEAAGLKIGGIVDAINKIARQTNMLALNAAIEAARAGESGRGFAVVADEVRALALKTRDATTEIGQRVHEIQDNAADAVRVIAISGAQMQRVSGKSKAAECAMTAIYEGMNTVVAGVSGISLAVNQQQGTSAHVTDNILAIVDGAGTILSLVENTRAETETLTSSAQRLRMLSNRFKA